jgi:hypothetical protein
MAKKAKKAKTTKTKKIAKKAVKKAATTNTAATAMLPASFELAANHPEKRYPASNGGDILCRWIDGQGTVCKPVPKGGTWDDG